MYKSKRTYQELSATVKRLEEKVKESQEHESALRNIEIVYAESLKKLDEMCREIYSIRSMVNMPQLYMDQNWNIAGYSSDFPLLSKEISKYVRQKKNIRGFFNKGDFDKIKKHQELIKSLENLPYDKGREWKLRYRGPRTSERIGKNWIVYTICENCRWEILNDCGKSKIIHKPHIRDHLDCCLMSAKEYGGADEDIKFSYKVRTSRNKTHLRDLSAIISGTSGREATTPDMFGYSVCVGSNYNNEGRIQKHGANVITHPEVLDLNSEYQITVERIGGRITRNVRNLRTNTEMPPIDFIDHDAVYNHRNHIGFYTYSGEAEIYDIEIYTRESLFSIDQFKLPIDITVGIRNEKLKGRMYKLKYAKNEIMGATLHTLMLEDVTERKKNEEALRESEEKYRTLFEESRDSLCITTQDGRFIDVNPEMLDLFGYSRQEMMDMDVHQLYAKPEDRTVYLNELENKGFARDYEVKMRKKDGTPMDCMITSTLRRDKNGSIFYQGSIHDVTERKRIEEQLKESQRMEVIGKLASGVAHEVRNPLNAILATSEALFQDIGDNPEFRPYLEHIRTHVDRLSTLMKDLLNLGKPLKRDSFTQASLMNICTGAILLWKQSSIHRGRKVRLVHSAANDNLEVFGDSSKLKQVLLNLLDNSAQHSPKESEILIDIPEAVNNNIKIFLIDRGTGLAEDHLSEVFKPFFTTRKRGAGLGLSIVKTITETHGGRIKLLNNDPPPGMTAEITLPLYRKDNK
jgi:PAS domain S-box-containing protein